MCEVISSIGNWSIHNASLIVACVAIVVAIWQGRKTVSSAKWQVEQTLKKQEEQQVAEQRYAIFLKVDEMFWHYITTQMNEKVHEKLGFTVQERLINPRDAHLEIIRLLNRPAGMDRSEIVFILSHLKDVLLLSTDNALAAVLAVHEALRKKLNPEVAKAFGELKKQEMENQLNSP